jgi:hypothetical protein
MVWQWRNGGCPQLERTKEEPEIMAIEGKMSRGSKRKKTDRDAVKGRRR